MLPIITKYLLQHRRVSIPHIGSFELKWKPAHLDVADKKIQAPVFITEYSSSDAVSEHQCNYFAQLSGSNKEHVRQDLFVYGQLLKDTIKRHSITWVGFGVLEAGDKQISFMPHEIRLDSLQSVEAHKVIRQNAVHRIRVGEQDISSHEATEIFHEGPKRRSLNNLIGWIIFVLLLALIIFFLYRGDFSPLSSGIQRKVMSQLSIGPPYPLV